MEETVGHIQASIDYSKVKSLNLPEKYMKEFQKLDKEKAIEYANKYYGRVSMDQWGLADVDVDQN